MAREVSEGSRAANPALCLILEPNEHTNVADVVSKAHTRGYDIYIAVRDTDTEKIKRFEQLSVTGMLRFREDVSTESIRDDLTDAVRRNGYSGAIFHDPAFPLDLEGSLGKVKKTDNYAIDSVTEQPQTQEIIVGIPAYNEEIGIGSTVHRAAKHSDEVIVIDDGSHDQTTEIARAAGATVLEHETNRGKGAAIQTFFAHLSEQSFNAAVLLDGDGQHHPEEIQDVAEPVRSGTADITIGSRYLEQNGQNETPRYRRVGQKILDLLTHGSSGQKFTDTQSGFRALSPTAVEHLDLTTDGIGIESEMINSASQNGLTIEEVPIDVRYNGIDGQTYNPLRHGLSVVTFILQLVRDRHPLLFFGLPGLFLVLAGGAYGIDAILIYQTTGNFYPAKVFVSGFTTILGVLGVFAGLILNQISNMIAEVER